MADTRKGLELRPHGGAGCYLRSGLCALRAGRCRQGLPRRFAGRQLWETICWRLRGFGRHTYAEDADKPRRETVWDLASLTKPIAAVSMAMLLYERGLLRLDDRVVSLLPEFASA